MSELRKNALNIYKKTWLESWLIGIFSGVLIAAILALNYLVPTIWIVTIPLFVLPVLFSAIISHIRLRFNEPLTFGNTLKEFFLFFRRPFNSSFSYLGSFFKSLVVFMGFLILTSSIGFSITYFFKPGINDSLKAVEDFLNDGKSISYQAIQDLLTMNDYALFTYLCIIIIPAFYCFSLVLIYFITRNATGVILRTNIKSNNPQFIKLVQNYVYARYRMKMFAKYMSLNWPIILLYSLGFTGGCIFALTFSISVLNILAFSLVGGLLLMSFYLPFYLCNMEAIYTDSAIFYADGLEYITKRIMAAMDMNAQNVEEQKRRFEEMMKNNQENNQEDNQGNEKDPPTGSN